MSNVKRQQRPLSRTLLLLGALPAVVMFIVLMVFFTSARLEDARRDLSDSGQMLADAWRPHSSTPWFRATPWHWIRSCPNHCDAATPTGSAFLT